MLSVGAKSGDYGTNPPYGVGELNQPSDYIHFGEDDQTFYADAGDVTRTNGQCLTGNRWTYRTTTAGITGTIAQGHTVVQATTNAAGTIIVQTGNPGTLSGTTRRWIGVEWNGSGSDFDVSGKLACTDQTSGGTLTPDYRTRWSLAGTWKPDARDVTRTPYTDADLGEPDWGTRHINYPLYTNHTVNAFYRDIVSQVMVLQVLDAWIMGLKTTWNHDALFDYIKLWVEQTAPGGEWDTDGYGNAVADSTRFYIYNIAFVKNMWNTYYAQYDVPMPPSPATTPSPGDAATHVYELADLSWTSGENSPLHRVYFGTVFADVNDGTGGTNKGQQYGTSYDPGHLDYGITYYWRIREDNADGHELGTVWTFTTRDKPVPPYGFIGGTY